MMYYGCKQCEMLSAMLDKDKINEYRQREKQFTEWVTKIQNSLHDLVACKNLCKHTTLAETTTKLLRLLHPTRSKRYLDTLPPKMVTEAKTNLISEDVKLLHPTTSKIYFDNDRIPAKIASEAKINLTSEDERLLHPTMSKRFLGIETFPPKMATGAKINLTGEDVTEKDKIDRVTFMSLPDSIREEPEITKKHETNRYSLDNIIRGWNLKKQRFSRRGISETTLAKIAREQEIKMRGADNDRLDLLARLNKDKKERFLNKLSVPDETPDKVSEYELLHKRQVLPESSKQSQTWLDNLNIDKITKERYFKKRFFISESMHKSKTTKNKDPKEHKISEIKINIPQTLSDTRSSYEYADERRSHIFLDDNADFIVRALGTSLSLPDFVTKDKSTQDYAFKELGKTDPSQNIIIQNKEKDYWRYPHDAPLDIKDMEESEFHRISVLQASLDNLIKDQMIEDRETALSDLEKRAMAWLENLIDYEYAEKSELAETSEGKALLSNALSDKLAEPKDLDDNQTMWFKETENLQLDEKNKGDDLLNEENNVDNRKRELERGLTWLINQKKLKSIQELKNIFMKEKDPKTGNLSRVGELLLDNLTKDKINKETHKGRRASWDENEVPENLVDIDLPETGSYPKLDKPAKKKKGVRIASLDTWITYLKSDELDFSDEEKAQALLYELTRDMESNEDDFRSNYKSASEDVPNNETSDKDTMTDAYDNNMISDKENLDQEFDKSPSIHTVFDELGKDTSIHSEESEESEKFDFEFGKRRTIHGFRSSQDRSDFEELIANYDHEKYTTMDRRDTKDEEKLIAQYDYEKDITTDYDPINRFGETIVKISENDQEIPSQRRKSRKSILSDVTRKSKDMNRKKSENIQEFPIPKRKISKTKMQAFLLGDDKTQEPKVPTSDHGIEGSSAKPRKAKIKVDNLGEDTSKQVKDNISESDEELSSSKSKIDDGISDAVHDKKGKGIRRKGKHMKTALVTSITSATKVLKVSKGGDEDDGKSPKNKKTGLDYLKLKMKTKDSVEFVKKSEKSEGTEKKVHKDQAKVSLKHDLHKDLPSDSLKDLNENKPLQDISHSVFGPSNIKNSPFIQSVSKLKIEKIERNQKKNPKKVGSDSLPYRAKRTGMQELSIRQVLLHKDKNAKIFIAPKKSAVKTLPILPDVIKLRSYRQRHRYAEQDTKESARVPEVVCADTKEDIIDEMIHYDAIVPYRAGLKPIIRSVKKPLLYRVQTTLPPVEMLKKTPSHSIVEEEEDKTEMVTVKYALSDKKFISNGWTQMPAIKTMRRVIIYRMAVIKPELNWFYRNKENRTLLYDTGEVLAEIEPNVSGKLFYKNGLVALDYFRGRGGVYKYVIYSHKIDHKVKILATPAVLGWFDHLGNAAVYDENGELRIQYNQFEGCVRDSSIGTPCKWKWHTLNDPPALEDMVTEQYEQLEQTVKEQDRHPSRTLYLDRMSRASHMSHKSFTSRMSTTTRVRCEDDERIAKREYQAMINLEVINLLRRQKKRAYRRLMIKSKTVGMSDCWSLNVIDQEHIYLRFRNEGVSIKFNLGLKLMSDNVLGLTKVEYSDTLVGVLSVPELMMP